MGNFSPITVNSRLVSSKSLLAQRDDDEAEVGGHQGVLGSDGLAEVFLGALSVAFLKKRTGLEDVQIGVAAHRLIEPIERGSHLCVLLVGKVTVDQEQIERRIVRAGGTEGADGSILLFGPQRPGGCQSRDKNVLVRLERVGKLVIDFHRPVPSRA